MKEVGQGVMKSANKTGRSVDYGNFPRKLFKEKLEQKSFNAFFLSMANVNSSTEVLTGH